MGKKYKKKLKFTLICVYVGVKGILGINEG